MACDRLLPRGNIVYVKTFQAVVSAVESGLCRFGVLPIENSSNGSVRAVYELLQDHNLSIVRSTRLCIRHELLTLPGVKMEDITEIYSHEQAIGQCSKFLNSLNGVRVIPCDNTAMAAKMVAEKGDRHAAAISSHPCAALYGLTCLNDSIQDSDNNYTRFICITKDPVIYAGANRISLIIAFDNRPGALYEILSKLAALDINMTKLESCPVAGSDFEFVFFLELDASVRIPASWPCWRRWSAAVPSSSSWATTRKSEPWMSGFTACWAGSWATAGPSPSMPPWATAPTAFSSWSRMDWLPFFTGRTSAA
ncbi:MAG: prephenate dehydratase [Dysosmobacter welbionis]